MDEPAVGFCQTDMEVRFMHISRLLSRRGIIVTVCFGVWIGAAGLICLAFVATPLPGDEAQVRLNNPAAVVHAETVNAVGPRIVLAQR